MWYKTYFTGLPQVAWQAFQTPEQDQLELEMLVESLELGPGDRVLDVFCGYGRHALPLARLGCAVTGIDLFADYTRALLTDAEPELDLTVLTGDFMTTPVAGPFDAAYCVGNSFSFFPRPQMLAFLRRIADALVPGGRFVAQTEMVAEIVLPDFRDRNWMPVSETIQLLFENDYDPLEGRIDSWQTFLQGGQSETRLAQHYLRTIAELCQLLTEAGFDPAISLCGDTDGRPFALGDESLWLVAQRVG
jgi:cyclopropane fatty-acyl-phospholipid synthase-like methyltransferase